MAINISIASDVTDVIRGTKNIAEGLEDVAEELEDLDKSDVKKLTGNLENAEDTLRGLAKTGGVAGEKIEGSLKEAGTGADRFEKKMSDAFRAAGRDADRAGKQIGTSQKEGLSRAGEGLDEFKSEANSTAREAAASFDGSAESIGDAFQETAANALAGFGPLGAAAGLALAAGIGIAMSALNGEAERVNELGEEVSGLAQEIRDAGGTLDGVDFESRMADWGLSIQDTREWFEIFQDKAKTGLEVIEEKARKAGVSWEDAFRGTKGTVEDSERALRLVNAQLEYVRENAVTVSDSMSGALDIDIGSKQQIEALKDLRSGYEENIATQEEAERVNRMLADAGIETAASIEAQAEASELAAEISDKHAEAAERLAGAIIETADALDRVAGANMSAEGAALKYQEQIGQTTETITANGATIDINTEAGRANRQALLDLAAASNTERDALIDAGAATDTVTAKTAAAREAFIRAADAAGYTEAEAGRLADQYGLIPKNVETYVKANNVANTENEINGVARPRNAPVNVVVGRDDVSNYIAGMNGQRVYVDVMPRGGGRNITN